MLSKIYILTFNHREPSVYPDQIEFRTQAEAEEALKMYNEDGEEIPENCFDVLAMTELPKEIRWNRKTYTFNPTSESWEVSGNLDA